MNSLSWSFTYDYSAGRGDIDLLELKFGLRLNLIMSTLPLHMYIRPLIVEDVEQVVALETKGFPPNERSPREVVEFRLSKCPELCSGLFLREIEGKDVVRETLIGEVMGTKLPSKHILLESMKLVHEESSDIVAIHSVVIDPEFQKKNLATLLLTDYIQKLSNQEVAKRITLIAHEPLVPFYERLGFKSQGENKDVAKDPVFSSSKWFDMDRELVKEEYEA